MTYHSDNDGYRLEVVEQALSIPDGGSDRGTCPKCHKSSSFSMSRSNNEIMYICFSLSCGFKGVITSKGADGISLEQNVIRQVKLFNGTLSTLHEHEVDYLVNTFRLEPEALANVRFSEQDMRVYYPQYDVLGRVHGYIARHYPALDGNQRTCGAKAYWKQTLKGDGGLMFPSMKVLQQVVDEQRVIVVEDYPSMLRINCQMGIPTVCLGGTNIFERHVSTMLSLGVRHLIILLDADAVTKAVKLKRSLALAFDSVSIVPLLGADPKDMRTYELDEILGAYR